MANGKKKAKQAKRYTENEPFPGRIGRTYDVSEPAFIERASPPKGAPNVLYVVIDDIGYGAIDTFGGLIEMPNVTRLADKGLRYTNFHTTALCSATRACLLTGRNHHSVGMGTITETSTGFPGYSGFQPMNKAGIGAMLHQRGYSSYAFGKWHNTPIQESGPNGAFDRWPDGPLFGFDRFYGFLGGDSNQWYPKLFDGRAPIDQPALPEDGYHLSEDLVDQTIARLSMHHSIEPDRPWLCYFAFGACHAPHHVPKRWVEHYRGKFDMGWDKYREVVLERQKKAGYVGRQSALAPMLDGVSTWDSLDPNRKKLFARMMETYAAFASHADEQLGRLIDSLEKAGMLDDTLTFVFIGDNGASGEGTLDGLYNEMTLVTADPLEVENVEMNLERIDSLGQPGSYNHFPVGWALAMNSPFKLCKQYTHFGGTRNPLVVHWPNGIEASGELRTQFHHVIDIVPTILQATQVDAPRIVNSVQQEPIEGVPMNYSFDDAKAPTTHPTQYFEMLGNRAIVDGKWKAVTYHGRKPWESRALWGFDEDHWELYDLEDDPTECRDLVAGVSAAQNDDPHMKKLLELVGLWWAEAGRYNVLPLDDRFQERVLARAGLEQRTRFVFHPGTIRVNREAMPPTLSRSWSASCEVEISRKGAEGPVVVTGGDTGGWSLYLQGSVPTFCYNFAAVELTYIRAHSPLEAGRHTLRYEFEIRPEKDENGKPIMLGAGGIGRIFVDGAQVGEGVIPRTMAFDYSLDETFDIGCDKGSPVTNEYKALAAFSGKILEVTIDTSPDFGFDAQKHGEAQTRVAMVRQ